MVQTLKSKLSVSDSWFVLLSGSEQWLAGWQTKMEKQSLFASLAPNNFYLSTFKLMYV